MRYQVLGYIGTTAYSRLYRARRLGDDAQVILKQLDPGSNDRGRFTRFRNEYALLRSLDISGVAKPAELIAEEDGLTMVLDDFTGESLESVLDSGKGMELPTCLHIATSLAQVLARVHEAGFMHRDIRPVNILVAVESHRILLADFSVAVPQDHGQVPEGPVADLHDWAYLSPEQTGRMNRTVDQRTDFYSFGIMLYRMLTGQLPFAADDPLEWTHCHIARTPPTPHHLAPRVPRAVSDIVMKLLAKLPEDRYQSAEGLRRDLDDCLAQWQNKGRIAAFPLGREDFSNRFQIPHKLYGRETELATLLAAFEQMVASGRRTLVTVTGYAGLGKSSLVEALRAPTAARHGYFIAGQFDQYLRNTPYGSLTQAFRELVRHVLSESETVLADWKRWIQDALGANGQVIIEVLPQLELILGKQAPVAELLPLEAQNRFRHVFRQFLGVFSRPDHPLVLFLDDAQWIDATSLQLIEDLMTSADSRHLLLIIAYRDNDLGAMHPLPGAIDAIRQGGASLHDIKLKPLSLPQFSRLVADTLKMPIPSCRPLARLVFERTGGNPFFFIQFLDSLHREGLLQWNARARAWQWDPEQIKSRDFSDNVADLMAGKLQRLPAGVRETLRLAACMGTNFDLKLLALVRGMAMDEIARHLSTAVREGLIVQTEGTGKFQHDRIQQAAYSLIPPERRNEVHLRIGRALWANLSGAELDAQLFDVANQFNLGAGLLLDPQERERVAELNLRAGTKAKATAAYASACDYLAAGMALLDEGDWERRYGLMFSLCRERAQCALLSGQFEVAAQLIDVLRQHGASNADQAAAYSLQIMLHSLRSEMLLAIESGLTCLRLFGIDIPLQPSEEQVKVEYETAWRKLGERAIEDLIGLPRLTDPKLQAIMDVGSDILVLTITRDAHLARVVLCRMVNLSLEHGVSGASAHAFATFATTLVGRDTHSNLLGCRFAQLAIDLVEKHDFLAHKGRVYLVMSVVVSWTQPLSVSLDYNQQAFRTTLENGDLAFACFGSSTRIGHMLQRGDPLDEVWRESEHALAFVRKSGYRDVADLIVNRQRLILAMQGRTAGLSSFGDEQFDEAEFAAQLHLPGRMALVPLFYWCFKLQAYFFAGDYGAALSAGEKADQFRWASAHTSAPTLEYHYYTALAIAALCQTAARKAQRALRAQLSTHETQLREWAQSYPPTFRDKHVLVAAEIARLDGHDLDAMHLYEQAVQSAHGNGFVQNEGIAHELAAAFCLARGLATSGKAHLVQARSCYARWGANGKVRQLDARYPQMHADTVRAPALPGNGENQLDLLSVSKAAQALSSHIVLDDLIDSLMRIVIENAGAQTGCLLLIRDDDLALAADANADQQTVMVRLHGKRPFTQAQLPLAILNYVRRSREYVLLADAAVPHPFSADPYFARRHPKSVLCLPILRQSALAGLLYLENDLASHVFTSSRIQVLEMFASQAAISLENAELFAALQQENVERKRVEETVRESNARIRCLVESNIIGVFFWDLSGSITDANDAFLQMVRYSRQDLLSDKLHLGRMTPPEYAMIDIKAKNELEQSSRATPYEKEFIRKDGGRVPVLIGATLFEKSKNTGVAFVLDLTEHRRAEAEREARRAAEAANQAKSTFLANMSHELRSPLNTILGFTRLLLERDPALSEAAREDLGLILKSGEHLHELINEVLDMAKLEAGRTSLNEADFNLDFLLDELKDMLTPTAVEKGLQLVFAPRPGVPPCLHGDPLKLRQILINLISNAIKFTRQGSVTVRVEASGPAAPDGHHRLRFRVTDTGPGIAPGERKHLFQSFAQARAGREAGEGTGLGLAISRGLVQRMGGEIHMESELGRGSTVSFDLPIQAAEHPPAPAGIPPRQVVGLAPGQPRYRILAVDDHAEARQLLVRLLTPLGFDVREAADGQEAIEQWRQWQPDLIWMDMRMPVLDGREATRLIRAEQAGKRPVIIALTASSFEEERQSALVSGCDDMLRKPFREADLFAALEKYLAVRFVYQETEPWPTAPLTAPAPVMLPDPLRARLEEAVARLDPEGIDQAIDAIGNINAQLAQALAASAREFQYDALLSLIRGVVQETK